LVNIQYFLFILGIRNISRGGADDTLTDAEIGSVPIDKVIIIYACGEKG